MPIKYYPDKIQAKYSHMAERWAEDERIQLDSGGQSIAADALEHVFTPMIDTSVTNITLHFDGGNCNVYAVKKIIGRGIVQDLNDILYIKIQGSLYQTITLDPGFYRTGALLATQLKTQLDANTVFQSAGATPFAVAYDAAAGTFTITPNAGQIKYINRNTAKSVEQYSTAGCVLGFTQNQGYAASVTSDTNTLDIGTETALADSVVLGAAADIAVTDPITLNVDEGILLEASVQGGLTARWGIDYKSKYLR